MGAHHHRARIASVAQRRDPRGAELLQERRRRSDRGSDASPLGRAAVLHSSATSAPGPVRTYQRRRSVPLSPSHSKLSATPVGHSWASQTRDLTRTGPSEVRDDRVGALHAPAPGLAARVEHRVARQALAQARPVAALDRGAEQLGNADRVTVLSGGGGIRTLEAPIDA